MNFPIPSQSDPHNKLKYVPEETRKKFIGQKIPSYKEFLELAVTYNKTIVFDLAQPPAGHPYYVGDVVELVANITLQSGIRQEQVGVVVVFVQEVTDDISFPLGKHITHQH